MAYSLPILNTRLSLMRTLILLTLLVLLAGAVTACDNKGPLYLPDEPVSETEQTTDDSEEQEDE